MGRPGPALGVPRSDGGLPAQLPGTCQCDGQDAGSPQEETLVLSGHPFLPLEDAPVGWWRRPA